MKGLRKVPSFTRASLTDYRYPYRHADVLAIYKRESQRYTRFEYFPATGHREMPLLITHLNPFEPLVAAVAVLPIRQGKLTWNICPGMHKMRTKP